MVTEIIGAFIVVGVVMFAGYFILGAIGLIFEWLDKK